MSVNRHTDVTEINIGYGVSVLPTHETMTEDQLQAACFQWAWNNYPQTRRLLWAVPNGGSRDVREGLKLRACGVIPGVWDMHLFYHGKLTVFELKVGRNQQSPQQVAWGVLVATHGATCFEIRTLEEFQRAFAQAIGT